MFFLKRLLFLVILLSFFQSYNYAQIKETSLSISVNDQLKNVVLDAEVMLLSKGIIKRRFKTDKLGIVKFSNLSEGEFTVNVLAKGFKKFEGKPFNLQKSENKHLHIELEISPIEAEIEINRIEGVDPDSFGSSKILNEEEINKLPDDPQELEKVLRQIYGETVSGGEVSINVNGILGEKLPPKQLIQQVRIDRNIFSAQYSGTDGGGIFILTRAGGTSFRGFAGFGFADSRLNASDPFINRKVPYNLRNYRFGFSGSFGRKTSYSFSGNHIEYGSSTIINAIVLDSNLQPITLLKTVETPSQTNLAQFTLNSDLTPKYKLYFSYNYSQNKNKGSGIGGLILPERSTNDNRQYNSFATSVTYLPNPNFVNITKFSSRYEKNKILGNINEIAINVLDSFWGGLAQIDNSNSVLRIEAYNDSSKQIRNHTLGFGFSFRMQQLSQFSKSNFGGTYTFSGRVAPLLDDNNKPIIENGNIINQSISSIESYRRTLLFRQLGYSNTEIRWLGGGADQFTISGGNPKIQATQLDYAFYLQNSVNVNDEFGFSLGVRYENQTNINSNFNLSPRFGMIWSPKTSNEKNQLFSLPRISFGFGVFYLRFDINNTLNARQLNNSDRFDYLISDNNVLDLFPSQPPVSILNQGLTAKSQMIISPQLDSPFQSLFSVTMNKKLPKKFSFNFTLTQAFGFNQLVTKNINAPLAGTYNFQNQNSAIYPFNYRGSIWEINSIGKNKISRVSTSVNIPNWKFFEFNFSYNFNKNLSNVVSGTGNPFDSYDFNNEFAPTYTDGISIFKGNIGGTLPRRFRFGLDLSLRTGSRFNIIIGRDINGDGYFSERPAFATNLNKQGLVTTSYGVLDPNPSVLDKIIPRNLGKGPNSFNANLNISKSFAFNEDKKNKKPPKQTLSLTMFVSNIFNINNKGNPIGNMSSPNFLRTISGVSEENIFLPSTPRSVNFSINVSF